jgi:hypothetical protein
MCLLRKAIHADLTKPFEERLRLPKALDGGFATTSFPTPINDSCQAMFIHPRPRFFFLIDIVKDRE